MTALALDPIAVAGAPPQLHGPELDEAAFQRLAALAHGEAGLSIAASKAAMVRTRLARRLRALHLQDFASYCALVESDDGRQELNAMISALTTNVSHFFREAHHFDILRDQVLPPLIEKLRAGGRLRIWSAGCSHGQEAYSIAITLRDAGLSIRDDVRILATDIDPTVIAHAQSGRYPASMLAGLPDALRIRHFSSAEDSAREVFQLDPDIAGLVTFRQLNLLRDWPMRGAFDAIFCRNVVIYFDAATQAQLWPRFSAQLSPGGWLFLGHSERISSEAQGLFARRGTTAYQRHDVSGRKE
jgi:chemotaxis protein methyltransferase CheR